MNISTRIMNFTDNSYYIANVLCGSLVSKTQGPA